MPIFEIAYRIRSRVMQGFESTCDMNGALMRAARAAFRTKTDVALQFQRCARPSAIQSTQIAYALCHGELKVTTYATHVFLIGI